MRLYWLGALFGTFRNSSFETSRVYSSSSFVVRPEICFRVLSKRSQRTSEHAHRLLCGGVSPIHVSNMYGPRA